MTNQAVNYAPVARTPHGKGPRTHRAARVLERRVVSERHPGRVNTPREHKTRRAAPAWYFQDPPNLWGPLHV